MDKQTEIMQEDEHILKMYKEKYIAALQEIEELKKRLSHYTDQSWEVERLRKEAYERDRYEWK